jgi:hypothetical protein
MMTIPSMLPLGPWYSQQLFFFYLY